MTDATLVQRVAAGDDDALAAIVARHGTLVHRTAALIAGPSHAADVAQEVFMALQDNAETIREGTALPRWLVTTARYRALDLVRSASSRREVAVPAPPDRLSPADEPTEGIVRGIAVQHLLQALSPSDRQLLTEAYIEERPLATIAASRDVTYGSLKVMLHRARRRARAAAERAGLPGLPVPAWHWVRTRVAALPHLDSAAISGIAAATVAALVVGLGGVATGPGRTPPPRAAASGLTASAASPPLAPAGGTSSAGARGSAAPAPAGASGSTTAPAPTRTGAAGGGSDRPGRVALPESRIPVPGTNGDITTSPEQREAPAYRLSAPLLQSNVSSDADDGNLLAEEGEALASRWCPALHAPPATQCEVDGEPID